MSATTPRRTEPDLIAACREVCGDVRPLRVSTTTPASLDVAIDRLENARDAAENGERY